ncbi:hypothetical protein [Sphingomonas xinjiangensis]|uniref:Uncharacterized protein n=1 Tax=Sphingomonas xinjiangensis TaxID=643568 RepID=A0A840YRL3_9SPHN|nr:hypothetical protein [Sphingomonas xinjiangensis]MBB5712362.1 hypothetical protein [Sphingomonas xinjiangensis]
MMVSTEPFTPEGGGAASPPSFIDFILQWMEASGATLRDLVEASEGRLNLTRVGRILHRNLEKRSAIRMDEVDEILRALKINHYHFALAVEMIRESPAATLEKHMPFIKVAAVAMSNLPLLFREAFEHINGLDQSDVKDEHGLAIQRIVIQNYTMVYADMARRKDERLGPFGRDF